MLASLKALLGSRKFYAGLIATIVVFVNAQLHWLNDVQIASVAGIISSWIVGQGIVDASK